MLQGISPLLTGELLLHLDAMGHSDAVVIADAHFPAARLARNAVVASAVSGPEMVSAVRSVLPLDDAPALQLMRSEEDGVLPVQKELMAACGSDDRSTEFVDRFRFYELAREASLIIRTGETRTYSNALIRKGLVTPQRPAAGG